MKLNRPRRKVSTGAFSDRVPSSRQAGTRQDAHPLANARGTVFRRARRLESFAESQTEDVWRLKMTRPQLAEFMRRMGQDSVAIIPAAREAVRSNDTNYRFRQDSDFFYLTGFEEPEAIAVIAPSRDTLHALRAAARPGRRDLDGLSRRSRRRESRVMARTQPSQSTSSTRSSQKFSTALHALLSASATATRTLTNKSSGHPRMRALGRRKARARRRPSQTPARSFTRCA